ncbi:MAG: hypothetical protein ACLU38_04160 [Dysosmobacter sp.]
MTSGTPARCGSLKRYADGHYAINQEVGGRVFYSSYQRATKAQIDCDLRPLLKTPDPGSGRAS